MNARLFKSTTLLAAAGLAASGCQTLTPGENAAVFGSMSGLAAGGIARAAGMSTAESIATGAAVGAIVAATAYVVSKHQATERQRRIAEERARVYYARLAPVQKTAMKKKRVRYIAVDTEKTAKTSPRAKKSVMLWDVQSQQIVGNDVYDLSSTPAVGQTAKFEPYSAQYVGTGL